MKIVTKSDSAVSTFSMKTMSLDEGIASDLSFLPSMLTLYIFHFFLHQVVLYGCLCQLEGKYQLFYSFGKTLNYIRH